jgi:RNA polymerase sigma factor (sigma-70 family)
MPVQVRLSDPLGSPLDPPPHTDPARWDDLIESVKPAAILVVLASTMSRRLKDHSSPEDIWQETLAHAWHDRDQHEWRDASAFRAWLFEIARNRIREAARSLATDKRGSGRAAARFSEMGATPSVSISGLLPADSVTPSRIVAHGEKAAAMRAALDALPPELEPIVRMHILEELPMETIAESLGIGVSAAWHRFRKGSEMYARRLAQLEGGEAPGGR